MARKKNIIVSVTNDLSTDQRVHRVCLTLTSMGFDVTLIGRKRQHSLPLKQRIYQTRRMRLIFTRGPLFYAEFNKRLFLYLLFHRTDVLLANDLDTLPANYLVHVIKRTPLVHDCHEYFTGMPELNGRETVRKIWKRIERWIFPKLKSVYAVNRSIADLFMQEYGIDVKVIRNVPLSIKDDSSVDLIDSGIPAEKKIILYQGAVNVDRGLEEAILAMKYVKTEAVLLIIGDGDIFGALVKMVKQEGLEEKVKLTGPVPLEILHAYTRLASIGISLEKETALNYRLSLPNKFLDYIQSFVPVLASPMIEMKTIIDRYRIGEVIRDHDPRHLAAHFDTLLGDKEKLMFYRNNSMIAAKDLCWENEEKELKKIFEPYA